MTHVCSPCAGTYETEKEYLAHECQAAGNVAPTTPEFLINTTMPNYEAVAAASRARGQERIEAAAAGEGDANAS